MGVLESPGKALDFFVSKRVGIPFNLWGENWHHSYACLQKRSHQSWFIYAFAF